MNDENQQLTLARTLLWSYAWKAQEPEAFKLFIDVPLRDMASRTNARPVLDSGWQIRFRFALCQDNRVMAAAQPYAVREDGRETPLLQWEEEALRAACIPLFGDFLEETTAKDGEQRPVLKSDAQLEPSDWSFPNVTVSPEIWDFLVRKGLAAKDRSSQIIPTEEGKQLGLCVVHWRRSLRFSRLRSLSCSAAGWLYRLWAPKQMPPLWQVLPLDTRLERMQAGRAGNLGHIITAFERLEAIPLEPVLAECIKGDSLKENIEKFPNMYEPGITYGQAARNVDRWLRSECQETRDMGRACFTNLMTVFYHKSMLVSSRANESASVSRGGSAAKKTTVLHAARPDNRSLSARLAWAGIPENVCGHFPLMRDDMEDIFQGLSVLLGTDAPARRFYQNVLPRLIPDWSRTKEEDLEVWDGSFDDMIWSIFNSDTWKWPESEEECAADTAPPCLAFADQVIWQLLIEPLCLLDQVWKLEEERVRLLESLRPQNERLKKELEGMKFDGSI